MIKKRRRNNPLNKIKATMRLRCPHCRKNFMKTMSVYRTSIEQLQVGMVAAPGKVDCPLCHKQSEFLVRRVKSGLYAVLVEVGHELVETIRKATLN